MHTRHATVGPHAPRLTVVQRAATNDRMRLASLCAVSSFLLPSLATAAPVWVGDFETNDLSQFDGLLNANINGVDYITLVQDVVVQGQYAARIELHDDAVWSNGLRRVELHHTPAPGRTAEGAQTWFAWSFYLPETLSADVDQSIGYWETASSYQQLLVWNVSGEQVTFATRFPEYVQHWQDDVATAGVWHRIAIHLVWSQDPDSGSVDVWFDGEQVVTAAAVATLADTNAAFTQLGLLRGNFDFDDVPVIYIDDAVEGDSYEDVHPELAPTGGESSSGGGDSAGDGGSSGGASTSGGSSTGGGTASASATGASASAGATAGDGTATGTNADDTAGESTSGAATDDGGGGCSCNGARGDAGGGRTIGLAGLALFAWRRRRRARHLTTGR